MKFAHYKTYDYLISGQDRSTEKWKSTHLSFERHIGCQVLQDQL